MFSNFSVLMSVYFKENPSYLTDCLDSLCNQTLKADEIVLVEDGPLTSELYNVIAEYKKVLPIKSISLVENKGLANALNVGLSFCSNEIIARMDTDDISLYNRFAVQYDYMINNPDVAACSAFLEERCDKMQTCIKVKKLPLTHYDLVKFCKFRSPLSHPVVMFRKSAVLAVGGYPNIYPEDYPLWCKLIHANYKLSNIPQVLLYMRAGDGMISRRGKAFLPGYIKCYKLLYQLGMIGKLRLIFNVTLQIFVRNLPQSILKKLYRYGRN